MLEQRRKTNYTAVHCSSSFFAPTHNNTNSFTGGRSFTIVVHANAAGESRVGPAIRALLP
jgi:hypothetical protein